MEMESLVGLNNGMNGGVIQCPICLGRGQVSRIEITSRLLTSLFGKEVMEIEKLISKTVEETGLQGSELIKTVIEKLKEEFRERTKSQIEVKEQEKANLKEEHRIYETKLLEDIASIKAEKDRIFKEKIELESRLGNIPALIGAAGEKEFEEEVIGRYPHFEIEKLTGEGDFIIWPKLEKNGDWISAKIPLLIDHKKKESKITRDDIEKLLRDAKSRSCEIAMIVAEKDDQLRKKDIVKSAMLVGQTFLIITSRERMPTCIDMLIPYMEMLYSSKQKKEVDYKEVLDTKTREVIQKINEFSEIEGSTSKIVKECTKIDKVVVRLTEEIRTICNLQAEEGT
ncbi:hypothetical protein HYU14_03460 [Candidatus Woesearchaeota archaeon]|nr:hypothetical protein [Candidatus Woesearchaeota archaeon]